MSDTIKVFDFKFSIASESQDGAMEILENDIKVRGIKTLLGLKPLVLEASFRQSGYLHPDGYVRQYAPPPEGFIAYPGVSSNTARAIPINKKDEAFGNRKVEGQLYWDGNQWK